MRDLRIPAIRVKELECKPSRCEEGGEHEVEFAVSQTKGFAEKPLSAFVAIIDCHCKYTKFDDGKMKKRMMGGWSGTTHFMPRHCREPLLNATMNLRRWAALGWSQRFGEKV